MGSHATEQGLQSYLQWFASRKSKDTERASAREWHSRTEEGRENRFLNLTLPAPAPLATLPQGPGVFHKNFSAKRIGPNRTLARFNFHRKRKVKFRRNLKFLLADTRSNPLWKSRARTFAW